MSLGALHTWSSSSLYATSSYPVFYSLPLDFEGVEYASVPSSPSSLPTDEPTQVLMQPDDLEGVVEQVIDWSLPDQDHHLPARRKPPVAPGDRFRGINPRTGSFQCADGYSTFIADETILKKHAMRFIDKGEKKDAVAITRDGYYVVLQQANSSCFPSCVTAMALYLKATPLIREVQDPATKSREREKKYFEAAGLKHVNHSLEGPPAQKVVNLLMLQHQKKFPGILHVCDSTTVGSHMVILISLSVGNKAITIMDPYHGWMITAKLDSFEPLIGERFIAIEKC